MIICQIIVRLLVIVENNCISIVKFKPSPQCGAPNAAYFEIITNTRMSYTGKKKKVMLFMLEKKLIMIPTVIARDTCHEGQSGVQIMTSLILNLSVM